MRLRPINRGDDHRKVRSDFRNIRRSGNMAVGHSSGFRVGHTATLLPNGQVLLDGGEPLTLFRLGSAEIYQPGRPNSPGLQQPHGSRKGRSTHSMYPKRSCKALGDSRTNTRKWTVISHCRKLFGQPTRTPAVSASASRSRNLRSQPSYPSSRSRSRPCCV